MLQQRIYKCLVLKNKAFVSGQHSDGFKSWIGGMDTKRGECILMSMNEMMLSRTEVQWKGYEKQMVTYDNDGNEAAPPPGFAVPQIGRFCLILVTHDESTFYTHDH